MKIHRTLQTLLVAALVLACWAPASGAASKDQEAKAEATAAGEWKEYWGTPGETDVTYHDQYRVTVAADGGVKVVIINRDQKIFEERLTGSLLTFKQRTDAFVVEYSLALNPDGSWLIGTATTPVKTYGVKWERTK